MADTKIIPLWVWLVLILVSAVLLVVRIAKQRRRAAFVKEMRIRSRRNIAEYKAWQWLFGHPKPLRLSDQRRAKAEKD